MEKQNVKLLVADINQLSPPPPPPPNIQVSWQEIIKRTILAINKYKTLGLIDANELNSAVQTLTGLFAKLQFLVSDNELKEIQHDLSAIIKLYGTESLVDLFTVCLPPTTLPAILHNTFTQDKYTLLKDYMHPISYKVISWNKLIHKNVKKPEKEPLPEDTLKKYLNEDTAASTPAQIEHLSNFECYEMKETTDFIQTISGIKIVIHISEQRKTLLINGLVDDMMLECLSNLFIQHKLTALCAKPLPPNIEGSTFQGYIKGLTLREMLIYSEEELLFQFKNSLNQAHLLKQKPIVEITTEFLAGELFEKRHILMQLLLHQTDPECQYLAYLLYDLLTSDTNGLIDTQEQSTLFDSLPWLVKKHFRAAMKQTITYTNNLAKIDLTKIPLEQQICLLKTTDIVKEKAMMKLKEVKAKTEDSGTKAKQYLDGLLKIPFSIFKEEAILHYMKECTTLFAQVMADLLSGESLAEFSLFPIKKKYTSLEVRAWMPLIQNTYLPLLQTQFKTTLQEEIMNTGRTKLMEYIGLINDLIKKLNLDQAKIRHSGKKSDYMRQAIKSFIQNTEYEHVYNFAELTKTNPSLKNMALTKKTLLKISDKYAGIRVYMDQIKQTLDEAVFGHEKAKRQIERIIGQWINGENTGYCFGFEGPPGVGKTSLAKKGIAHCLKDAQGQTRPFAFIAIGGSANSSTLDGHNYTYVGSTWGRIVDILMETKCLNPIIFIDELDKVSKTDHGKEIIGILTHLIDPTQNDAFQDKYFNGIDLDLSKALFIFSYNDVDAIDRVLLDRIHRIKFEHLSLVDKLVISKEHLLPDIYAKMGLVDIIQIPDPVIEYIITEYTCEPGVRKLKELLFEIVGEINLALLKEGCDVIPTSLPIKIDTDMIKTRYLKDRRETRQAHINLSPAIGVINGLWANALGMGGVLQIEGAYYPSTTLLDFKLTGLQGEVMKESMNVAKTLAWSLLTPDEKAAILPQGVHIHVPEGATPKDGPSAGTAITVTLYSLFTQKKIKNTVAITGEICLQGRITAIGGLDLKILGGMKAGVTHFIYPHENAVDYTIFKEKYQENPTFFQQITFTAVSTIQEVLALIFAD